MKTLIALSLTFFAAQAATAQDKNSPACKQAQAASTKAIATKGLSTNQLAKVFKEEDVACGTQTAKPPQEEAPKPAVVKLDPCAAAWREATYASLQNETKSLATLLNAAEEACRTAAAATPAPKEPKTVVPQIEGYAELNQAGQELDKQIELLNGDALNKIAVQMEIPIDDRDRAVVALGIQKYRMALAKIRKIQEDTEYDTKFLGILLEKRLKAGMSDENYLPVKKLVDNMDAAQLWHPSPDQVALYNQGINFLKGLPDPPKNQKPQFKIPHILTDWMMK
jgi:hypothetical protein